MAGAVTEKKKKDEVKLSGATSKKKVEPSKRTLNLAIRERRYPDPKKWIPGVLVVIILAALFSKFAVVDRYAKLNEAEAELAGKKAELAATQAQYADYDEVRERYNMYSYEGFDRTIADRLDVMDLLRRDVFPVCEVQDLSVSGKTINLSVTDLNLSQISQLIATLEGEPMVSSVTVFTASDDREATMGAASLSVELMDAADDTGYVGIHEEADYTNMTAADTVVCGMQLFAERLDGVVKADIGGGA